MVCQQFIANFIWWIWFKEVMVIINFLLFVRKLECILWTRKLRNRTH